MSKLIDSLKADLTGERRYGHLPIETKATISKSDTDVPYFPADRQVYHVHAGLDYKFASYPEDVKHVIKNTHRRLVADIYGDFINEMITLERLVLQQDAPPTPAMLDQFTKIYKMMRA